MSNSQDRQATPILPKRLVTPWTAVNIKYWYRKELSAITANIARLDQEAGSGSLPSSAVEKQRAMYLGQKSRLTLSLYKKLNKVDASLKKERASLEQISPETRSQPDNQKKEEELMWEEAAMKKCVEMYQRDS